MTGDLKAGSSVEQAILTLVNRIDKLCEQVNHSRVKKYGTPRSREFRLPPRRSTTADRNARLVCIYNCPPMVLLYVIRVLFALS